LFAAKKYFLIIKSFSLSISADDNTVIFSAILIVLDNRFLCPGCIYASHFGIVDFYGSKPVVAASAAGSLKAFKRSLNLNFIAPRFSKSDEGPFFFFVDAQKELHGYGHCRVDAWKTYSGKCTFMKKHVTWN
jgi:hypothetical protein